MTLELQLKQAYLRKHPIDATRCIEAIPIRSLHKHVGGLDPGGLVPCLDLLPDSRAIAVFELLNIEEQQEALREAPQRLALTLLAGMDESARNKLLDSVPPALRSDLDRLQQYDKDSAGRLLERPYDTIRTDMTVSQALEVLRESGATRLRSLYVVDRDSHLVGKVDMQSMAMAQPGQRLNELLDGLEGTVQVTARRSEVVEKLDEFRVDSLPVVDVEGRLLGVVRYNNLFDAIETEATASMQKMVGASADERALSTAGFAVKRRLPWLHINLLTAFLAAAVVGRW